MVVLFVSLVVFILVCAVAGGYLLDMLDKEKTLQRTIQKYEKQVEKADRKLAIIPEGNYNRSRWKNVKDYAELQIQLAKDDLEMLEVEREEKKSLDG